MLNKSNHKRIINIVHISLFAILLSICSMITIPMAVPITLQTFGVFVTCLLIGGKRATLSIIIWILLGIIGLPVFSGFKSGLATLLGPTGGYIIGFIFTALLMWLAENIFPKKITWTIFSMLLGLILCYTIGTIWFVMIYTNTGNNMTISKALSICVLPFILFDILKMFLALIIGNNKTIKMLLKLSN